MYFRGSCTSVVYYYNFLEEFHLVISWSFTPHIWFLCLFMVLSLYFCQNVLVTCFFFSLFFSSLLLSFFFLFLFSLPSPPSFLFKQVGKDCWNFFLGFLLSCAIVLSGVFPYMIIEVQYTVVLFSLVSHTTTVGF